MAIVGYPLARERPEYVQKVYQVSIFKGVMRAQKWRRKQGTSPLPYMRESTQWLKAMVQAYKFSSSRTTEVAREAGKITRVRPQDRWLHVTSGREWLLDRPGGGLIYPQRFWFLVSNALDACSYAPGGILVRGADEWRPLAAGAPGSQLVMGATYPQWSDGTMIDNTTPNTPFSTGVSQDLDVLGTEPGSIALRGDQWWATLPPGVPGSVLTVDADGNPMWKAP